MGVLPPVLAHTRRIEGDAAWPGYRVRVEGRRLYSHQMRAFQLLQVGAARFMLADEFPEVGHVGPATLGGTTVTIAIYVTDVDALTAQAIAAGATLLRPVKDEFHGDRVAVLQDPFGHRWRFATRVEEVSPAEMQRRLAAVTG